MWSKVGSWHVGVVESSLLSCSSSFFSQGIGLVVIFPGNSSVRSISVCFFCDLNPELLFFLKDLEVILLVVKCICQHCF